MNDNIDLLTKRLHSYIDQLRDPAYSRDPYVCVAVADHLVYLMYGGVNGHEPVPPALDRQRWENRT